MGQGQSLPKSLVKQGTFSLASNESDITIQPSESELSHQTEEERLEIDEEQFDEGVITVATSSAPLEEEELILLKSIQKFEPFIREQEKSRGVDQILGLKSKVKSTASSLYEEENGVDLNEPVLGIFFGLQKHIKEHMHHINLDQRSLLKRIAYVDELSGIAAQAMVSTLNQAKLKSAKLPELHTLKNQISQIQDDAAHIFKTLSALEEQLGPADRISSDIKATRWPELNQFRTDASKPSIERYISSSSDLAIVATTSAPFMLDQMLEENGNENVTDVHRTDEGKTSNAVEPNSASVSLALDRLRGLSSQSLATEEDNK